ncbi:MAG: AhpC/TSA family protein [Bacteroidales bacterium]|nr:AhpC/TSA family protein [Bacteroidales bacterium]
MKKLLILAAIAMMVFAGCNDKKPAANDYCVVKGTIKGIKEGKKLDLFDAFNDWVVVGQDIIKDGAFEIHPEVTSPTHVYLYVHNGKQLKDFILEPGTILVEVDAADEYDYETGAKGTPLNDLDQIITGYRRSGNYAAADSLRAIVMNANPAGALALANIEEWCKSSSEMLDVLDRLTPELAQLSYAEKLRKEATQRLKTEAGGTYIDMKYPDLNGDTVSLSSVVNNPANRYVIVDFWASWCDGCLDDLPTLVEIYEKYHDKGLEIYGLSVDTQRRYKYWKSCIEKNNMKWVNVCDYSGGMRGNSKVRDDYAIIAYPTTILIDCQTGKIVMRDDIEDIEPKLAELLQ